MGYRFGFYRFNIESSVMEMPEDIVFNKDGTIVDAPCTSIKTIHSINLYKDINWDYFDMYATNEELKGLADFIYKYLEKNNDYK
jgi:hypothetical protein